MAVLEHMALCCLWKLKINPEVRTRKCSNTAGALHVCLPAFGALSKRLLSLNTSPALIFKSQVVSSSGRSLSLNFKTSGWMEESHTLLWTPMEFYRGKANCIISQTSLGLIRITGLRAGNEVARHRAALPPSIPIISKSTTIFNCREVKRSSQAAWTCQSSNWALLTQKQLQVEAKCKESSARPAALAAWCDPKQEQQGGQQNGTGTTASHSFGVVRQREYDWAASHFLPSGGTLCHQHCGLRAALGIEKQWLKLKFAQSTGIGVRLSQFTFKVSALVKA